MCGDKVELSAVPIDISADQVKEIGAACASVAAPQSAQASQPTQAQPLPQVTPQTQQPQIQAPKPIEQTTPASRSEPPTWPRFAVWGSDAVGARLLPALVDAYAKKMGWTTSARPAENASQEIELSAPGSSRPALSVIITSKDSASAVEGMLHHEAVFGMTSRRLTADEAKQINAKLHVDVLAPTAGAEHVLALDALAVIVHPDNPIKRLGQDAISKVFSGRVTNWKDVKGWGEEGDEVSGRDTAIKVHVPQAGSDNAQFFHEALMPSGAGAYSASAEQHATDDSLSRSVADDVNAIGFVAFPQINKNYPLIIRSSCGLTSAVSRYSIKTEEYPLARRLYLYSYSELKQQEAKDFIQFVLSDEAQKAILEAGYIDQSVEYQDAVEQRDWALALERNPRLGIPDTKSDFARPSGQAGPGTNFVTMQKAFSMGASYQQRMAVVFRFERNSAKLDTRAIQDIARLARHLKPINLDQRPVILMGFADWDGNGNQNMQLSTIRAQGVLAELKRLRSSANVDKVVAAGWGPIAPVACNDTPEGKAKNRRVEVWVKRSEKGAN